MEESESFVTSLSCTACTAEESCFVTSVFNGRVTEYLLRQCTMKESSFSQTVIHDWLDFAAEFVNRTR